ncbi:MAG TPA: flagellar biosynthesis protein FliQ [Bacteroidota bacterium]|nr:flagellar biosynthesis protein FliQ [Bacteroidota bacterium]
MNEVYVIHLLREAFYTVFLLAGPVLIVTMVVGLIISIFQAATSIQEMTLTFVPKAIIVAVVLILTLPWMFDIMISFTVQVFTQIPNIIK